MKKLVKILLIVLGVIVLLIVGAYAYLMLALPNVGAAPEMTVDVTPERVERGRYLAMNVTNCFACHSDVDHEYFGGKIKEDYLGSGGRVLDHSAGFPGEIHTPNITPFALGDWTDGEIYRAITMGVSKDGRPLFPIMPYQKYGKMDMEDIKDIIAYLRTIPAVERDVPKSKLDFPLNLIVRTMPKKADHKDRPSPDDQVAYGRYLANAASCMSCHSSMDDQGGYIEGKEFAGGNEFPLPSGDIVRSANITPDMETGIGSWDEGRFVTAFKQYEHNPVKVKEGAMQTEMPWNTFAEMRESDLKAIYAYLKTLSPINNPIEKFEPDGMTKRLATN